MIAYILASPIQILKTIKEVNKANISYDYDLHNYLLNFSTNGSWYYSPNDLGLSYYIPSIDKSRNLNKDFLMEFPEFKRYKDLGYKYLFSDTSNNKIASIFQFRNLQMGCFNWNKCSKTTFNEYTTCLKGKPQLKGQKKCSFAYSYLPKYLNPEIDKIACILLDFVSPYTPSNQPFSFACYYRLRTNRTLVDYPF
jgi:hypothetical protein